MRKLASRLFEKAQSNRFFRWLLNALLLRKIPFNKAHRPAISVLGDEMVEVRLPFRRSNRNHLNGMHACALAMVGEMAAGIRLKSALDTDRYRIIMQKMQVEYAHQARGDVIARCDASAAWIESEVIEPLSRTDSVTVSLDCAVRDLAGKSICTVTTTWQIKSWDKVRSK